MGLDDALTDGQADAHTPRGVAGELFVQLLAGLHGLADLGGQALAPVPDLYHRPVVLAEQVQGDVLGVAGVADGVFQQIHHHLLDQHGFHGKI